MSGDEQVRFVGGWQAPGMPHGPAAVSAGGIHYSCTYSGNNAWAVDERGNIYNLAQDMRRDGFPFVWVKVRVPIVRDPAEQG